MSKIWSSKNIIIKENEVIFNVKIKTIIDKTSKINKELGKLIKENNIKDIIRKAIINDEKEIIKSEMEKRFADKSEKEKIMRYFVSRGFSLSDVRSCIDEE